MERVDAHRASGRVAGADPSEDTVIHNVPYVANRLVPVERDAPIDQSGGRLAEDVKRRQIALTVRYVAVMRSALW